MKPDTKHLDPALWAAGFDREDWDHPFVAQKQVTREELEEVYDAGRRPGKSTLMSDLLETRILDSEVWAKLEDQKIEEYNAVLDASSYEKVMVPAPKEEPPVVIDEETPFVWNRWDKKSGKYLLIDLLEAMHPQPARPPAPRDFTNPGGMAGVSQGSVTTQNEDDHHTKRELLYQLYRKVYGKQGRYTPHYSLRECRRRSRKQHGVQSVGADVQLPGGASTQAQRTRAEAPAGPDRRSVEGAGVEHSSVGAAV